MTQTPDFQTWAHSPLGASGAKKWLACSMAPAVELSLPEEDSEYAAEGTYAHGLAELLLRCYLSGNDGADLFELEAYCDPEQNEDAASYYSEDLGDHVQSFVDLVTTRYEELIEEHGTGNVELLVEQRVRYDRWVPQGFGTCDAILLYPGGMDVIDLKYGVGVKVHGKNNPQLKLYALGALQTHGWAHDFKQVTTTIVQPRLEHVESDTFSVDELLLWAEELIRPRAAIAYAAICGDYSKAAFSPGEHCAQAFCKARFTCPARARYELEKLEFQIPEGDPLAQLPVEELEKLAANAAGPTRWLSDVKRGLLAAADTGKVQLVHWDIAHTKGTRVITDQAAAAQRLMQAGYAAQDVFAQPKLRGILQLETLVGGPAKLTEILGDSLGLSDPSPYLRPLAPGEKPTPRDHGDVEDTGPKVSGDEAFDGADGDE